MTEDYKPVVKQLPEFEPSVFVKEGTAVVAAKDGILYVVNADAGTVRRVEWAPDKSP